MIGLLKRILALLVGAFAFLTGRKTAKQAATIKDLSGHIKTTEAMYEADHNFPVAADAAQQWLRDRAKDQR